MSLQSVIIPIFVLGIILYGLHKKVDIFSVFVKGAKENILVGVDILPSLVMLMLAVGMFRASGAMDAFSELISPLLHRCGILRCDKDPQDPPCAAVCACGGYYGVFAVGVGGEGVSGMRGTACTAVKRYERIVLLMDCR